MNYHNTLIVTGGSRGIGKAITTEIASLFKEIHFFGRDIDSLKILSKKLNTKCHIHKIDLSKQSEIKKMERILKKLKSNITAILYSAGYGLPQEIHNLSIKNSKKIMNINYYGFLAIAINVLPIMKSNQFGTIVLIGSISERRSVSYMTDYAASKSALISAAQCLAMETIQDNIAINILTPGSVKTDLGDKGRKILSKINNTNNTNEEKSDILRKKNLPFNELLLPTDIQPMAFFLFSQKKAVISGQVITIAGTTHMN